MNAEQDTRDRVIRLEAEVEALTKTVDSMARKVNEMHTLLTQARGAKYVIVASAAAGGFISAKLAWLFPWMGGGNG